MTAVFPARPGSPDIDLVSLRELPYDVKPESGAQKAAQVPLSANSMAPAASSPAKITVRRIHRRDLNRVWEFLKLVFRDVNRETVEYQRPRSKHRFLEVYDEEGVEQLLFAVGKLI